MGPSKSHPLCILGFELARLARERPLPEAPAQVINLWVRRTERERERAEGQEIWTCMCGWRFFEILRGKGPVCAKCGRPADPPL